MATDPVVHPGRAAVDALTPLPLPQFLHLLTTEQFRGAGCMWCGEPLGAAAAFVFGTHTAAIEGEPEFQWFPRACHSCVGQKARQAHHEHKLRCEQCTDDPALCAEREALWPLIMAVPR